MAGFSIKTTKGLGLFLILILGTAYLVYTYISTKNDLNYAALQVAKTVAASLPKKELQKLEAKAEDLTKPEYQVIKSTLISLARIGNEARFAYLYKERNGKIYLIADSEKATSKVYTPPGIECPKTHYKIFRQPLTDGKVSVTLTKTIRGDWMIALVPIKDPVTKKTTAVFAMDYYVDSWRYSIFYRMVQSTLLIVLSTMIFLYFMSIKTKNVLLKREIKEREEADLKLRESKDAGDQRFKIKHYN